MTPPITSLQTPLESPEAARAHYARIAELSAYRYEHAVARRRYSAAARAERDYKRASRRCRALGEQIRVGRLDDAA